MLISGGASCVQLLAFLHSGSAMRLLCAGLLFAAMAVVSFVGVMPASFVADKLGRKWTIVPSCLGLAGALLLMAFTGTHPDASRTR